MNLPGIKVGNHGVRRFPSLREAQVEQDRLAQCFAKRSHSLLDVIVGIQRMKRAALLTAGNWLSRESISWSDITLLYTRSRMKSTVLGKIGELQNSDFANLQ